MTLQQLKYITLVAEKGNITDAAKALYISQPSLTAAIKELEKEMNIQIFDRTNKGVHVSKEGELFLGYARQILEQVYLLEDHYKNEGTRKQEFCISTQHYSFAVNAFVDLIKEYGQNEYDFSLRETQTYEIIEDVARMKSEIGVLYLDSFNEPVIRKLLKTSQLQFEPLFTARPHIFISSSHPLAKKKVISLHELSPYPYLSFEQGDNGSFYFAEEIFSTNVYPRTIKANDRATMLNLMIGLNGYTLCSGIICEELNGTDYIAVPLEDEGDSAGNNMEIGYIVKKDVILSSMGELYIKEIDRYLRESVK